MDKCMEVDGGSTIAIMCKLVETSLVVPYFVQFFAAISTVLIRRIM